MTQQKDDLDDDLELEARYEPLKARAGRDAQLLAVHERMVELWREIRYLAWKLGNWNLAAEIRHAVIMRLCDIIIELEGLYQEIDAPSFEAAPPPESKVN